MVKIRSVYCCLWIEGMIGKVSFMAIFVWCTIVAIHHPLEGRSCPGIIDATTKLLNSPIRLNISNYKPSIHVLN